MQIVISTKGKAQVTINGKNVPSVDAAIIVQPNELQTEIVGTLQTFLKNVEVVSNVSDVTASIPNDTSTDPEVLMEDCNQAVIDALTNLGYGVKIK